MTLAGIALQHAADDGYSRRGNAGGSSAHMVLIYAPDGSNIYSSRGWESEGIT